MVVGIVILFVASDIIAFSWPPAPTTLSWRYGVVGLVSGALYNPFFAILLAVIAAAFADHRPMLRILVGLSVFGSLLLVAMLGIFALDAIELRALARQGSNLGTFDRAGFQVVLKLAVGAMGFAVIGLFGFRPLSSSKRSKPPALPSATLVKPPRMPDERPSRVGLDADSPPEE